jgi:hypothetical protein
MMFRWLPGAALAAALLTSASAHAQDSAVDEIVVTGVRAGGYENYQIPHVFMKRRADFAIIELEVRCDTRDLSQRREEMRQALRGLEQRARPGAVTLALVDEDVGLVREFSLAAAEELIKADRRPDSSMLSIMLRTPVGAADTLDTIHARIERFAEAAPKPGRVEMETGDTQLTLVNPEQYRESMLHSAAADGRAVAAMLGENYGVRLTGLERQVVWKRTGDLELTLFVPYALETAPAQ